MSLSWYCGNIWFLVLCRGYTKLFNHSFYCKKCSQRNNVLIKHLNIIVNALISRFSGVNEGGILKKDFVMQPSVKINMSLLYQKYDIYL